MFKLILNYTQDNNLVWLKRENCLGVKSNSTFTLKPNQVKVLDLNIGYKTEECVGIAYTDRSIQHELSLYHMDGKFKLINESKKFITMKIVLKNMTNKNITITKEQDICWIALMTIPFYKLNKRNDNSDYGLRSSVVKVEFNNES